MNCFLIAYWVLKGTWGRICEKINMHFKFFNADGWWSVQKQKEWAHPHISSLPWTGCVLHSELLVSLAAFDSYTGRRQAWWTQTSVGVVMDSTTARKRPTTTQSTLNSHTESKQNYDQSRAGTRINIGYAFDWWRQLHPELGLKTDADMAHFLVTR